VQATFACGSADSPTRTLVVLTAPAMCTALSTPIVISYPPVVLTGQPYTIRWSTSPNATYQIDESRTGDFTDAVSRTSSDTFANFPAQIAAGRFFYRVRAISTCGLSPSNFSATVRVDVVAAEAGNDITISIVIGSGIVRLPLDLNALFGSSEIAGETYTITSNSTWLTASPATGQAGSVVTLFIDSSMLSPGVTEGELSVTLSGGQHATVRLFVNLVPGVSTQPQTPPPPDSLIIPGVAHADGVSARFQSDVRIANTSAVAQSYRLILTPTGSGGSAKTRETSFDVVPGRTIALDDILSTWFGTLAGEGILGSLEIRPAIGSPAPVASSRTYAVTAGGTYGQYIPAIPVSRFVRRGTVLTLQQIAQSSSYRTNIGLVEASGNPAVVDFTVFNAAGQRIGGFTQAIGGGEHLQLNSVLAQNGIAVNDGRIEARVTSDLGVVAVYASVLDNQTSDPMLIDGVVPAAQTAARHVLPGIADISGGLANWRSDVRLYNASSEGADVTLTFYPQGNPAGASTLPLTIASGEMKVLDDVLRSSFGLTGTGGALHITTEKALPIVATARTYNRTEAGTYGQFIPAVTTAQAVGRGETALQLLQLEESSRTRTNVGLTEVSGNGAVVEIDLQFADGTSAPIVATLAPYEFRQLNQIIRSVAPDGAYNVRATVRVISGDGRVAAYVSAIDNRTQDPTYIPGLR